MSLYTCKSKSNSNPCEEVNEGSTDSDSDGNNRKDSQQLSDNTFICSVNDCGKEFRRKLYLNRHVRRCHSEKTLRCHHSECGFVTADKGCLKQHLITHSDERLFTCETDGCGKEFKTKGQLIKHQITHRSKLFQSTREGCEQTFKAERYLKQHINNIHLSSLKSFVCSDCGKGFDTNGERRYHQRVVHPKGDQPIICQIENCNQQFKSMYFYKLHHRKCHSDHEYRCDHSGCNYVTKRRNLLNFHMRKHSQSRPLICGVYGCVKAFKVKAQLTNHKKIHSSERFRCTEDGCRQVFKYIKNLDKHIDSVHSTKYKRSFFCDTFGCGMSFKRKLALQRHKRTHYKTILVCHYDNCNMIFNDKKMLKYHVDKIHLHLTVEYSCEWPECNYTTDKYHLYYYHKAVHIGDRFECTHSECEETFDTKDEMNIHEKTHPLTNN